MVVLNYDIAPFVFCEYYVPHDYYPIVIFQLESSAPPRFLEDSNWRNLRTDEGVRFRTKDLHEQHVVIWEPYLPISIVRSNETIPKPIIHDGDSGYHTDLTIIVMDNCTITGKLETQARNLYFGTESNDPVTLTIRHLYEYSVRWSYNPQWGEIDAGLYADNRKVNLSVVFEDNTGY